MAMDEASPRPAVSKIDDEYELIKFCTNLGCFGNPEYDCPGDSKCAIIQAVFNTTPKASQ